VVAVPLTHEDGAVVADDESETTGVTEAELGSETVGEGVESDEASGDAVKETTPDTVPAVLAEAQALVLRDEMSDSDGMPEALAVVHACVKESGNGGL
jgi:hypothetical protein